MILMPAVRDALDVAPLWWLATVEAHQPNLVPIGYKEVWGERLLLVDLFLGRTRDNLRVNPRVALAVATPRPKVGFRLFGAATVHERGDAWEAARDLLAMEGIHTTPKAAIVIDVDAVFALDPGGSAGRLLQTM